jgi:hypothetical protein
VPCRSPSGPDNTAARERFEGWKSELAETEPDAATLGGGIELF